MSNWVVHPTYTTQAALQAALAGFHPDAVQVMKVDAGLVLIVDTAFPKLKHPNGSDVQWDLNIYPSNAAIEAATGMAALANPHHAKVFHGPGGFGVFSVPGSVTLG
jgi:hypothetical protein